MALKKTPVLFLLLFIVTPLFSEPEATPEGFGSLILGLDMEEVKNNLSEDPNFDFVGDPDVSLLMRPNESLIECRGFSYIHRAYFQFHENILYTISLVMNPEMIDHYALYTTFVGKYGPPVRLSPSEAVWESERFLFSLERPLTVKYLDKETFEALRRQGIMEKSVETLSREQFLELF
ncbi:MAG: hypothetical protein JW760_13585 [Spirochaetales bacterium]|nr:hypothetical protein [Spirochaetales bacterium]